MSKKKLNIKNPADMFISSSQDNSESNKAQRALGTQQKQDTQSEVYEQEKQDTQQEQGKRKPTSKRGQKLPRINIAFTYQNLDYLQRISRLEDTSITQYVNDLINSDRENRIEGLEEAEKALEKAKQILKKY